MVLLAHPGTQYSHQLARQLVRRSWLSEFWTGFALSKDSWYATPLKTLLPERWSKRIANRFIRDVPARYLRTTPFIEWKALRQLQSGKSAQSVFFERNRVFQEIISTSSIKKATGIIGFDTSSWLLAEKAKNAGKPFFLDQSISHPLANESILREVIERYPEWQEDFQQKPALMLDAEKREHELAGKIVVASRFTRQTLISEGVDADKIVVNPYGVDVQRFNPSNLARSQRPLRFIFVGLISARKGVPLLLEAWKSLASLNAELWLVGPVADSIRPLLPPLPGLKLLGKRPHEELPELFRQCDVFVFPSFCEGFGLVLLEALASGLPIITTEATAGPDLISDGNEGYIIKSGDTDALCHTMQSFIDNPDQVKAMSEAARRCAEKYTWEAYGDRWDKILRDNIGC
jgi:glycosyltransferase involved in cell wall biosynthesis